MSLCGAQYFTIYLGGKFIMNNDLTRRKAGVSTRWGVRMCLALTLTGILTISSGPARSIEIDQSSPAIAGENSPLSYKTSPHAAISDEKCLSLLKAVRYDNASSAMDRSRHSAGKATALGLVFGVRFALGPKEVMKNTRSGDAVRFGLWEARDKDVNAAQALAISDYRRCKNEQTLRGLSDWRWQR